LVFGYFLVKRLDTWLLSYSKENPYFRERLITNRDKAPKHMRLQEGDYEHNKERKSR
jgi:hypothetical protein